MSRSQTYEEKRTAEELRPQFLAAMGHDTSIVRAAEWTGVSYCVLTRWFGQEGGLALEHHDAVRRFIAQMPVLCPQKRGTKRGGRVTSVGKAIHESAL